MPSRAKPLNLASRRPGLSVFGLLGMAAVGAHAQSDGSPPTTVKTHLFTVDTGLTVSQTLTDNVNLSSTDKQSDLITQLSPSISARSNAGRIQGYFTYSLNQILYARESGLNTLQQSLSAAGKAEAIENFAYVDASANISRQNVSALGAQSPDSSLQTSNQSEVKSASVSPYVLGRLGGFANYQVRLSYATTHTDSDEIGSSSDLNGSAHLGSNGGALLGWALDATRDEVDFTQGRRTESDTEIGTLFFNPDVELQFSARVGRESNNYVTLNRQSDTTYGAGIQWVPSPRTTLSAQYDKHYYGDTYSIVFQHREARTAWTLSDTRAVITNAGSAGLSTSQTAYNVLYLQLTSLYPDPVQRANQTLIELQSLGINPNALVLGGFLANSIYVQRSEALSFSYLGLRTSVIVSAQLTDSSQLDTASPGVDSVSNGISVRQRSLSVTLAERLTPLSSASLALNESRSNGGAGGSEVSLFTMNASWTSQIATRANLLVGVRHSISSGAAGYTESALLATLSLQF